MARRPPFPEEAARAAIAESKCWADALRLLGYKPRGRNHRTLRRWAEHWSIPTDHFDPHVGRRRAGRSKEIPLDQLLVEGSTYSRDKLKRRLFESGIKARRCELCGQDENWKGRKMSLVLDHINGISNDNRVENLRMVCPNCAATLDTHCGRKLPRERTCPGCGKSFEPRDLRHRYCSRPCWGAISSRLKQGTPQPDRRKVERPSYEQLMSELAELSYVAVGRKYGVSDNAVRKWVRWYAAQRAGPRPAGGVSPEP
jgi:hypothetical protein